MASQRVVVVTGAESGIGAACARALGETGAQVAVFYLRDRDAAGHTVRDVCGAGGTAMPVPCAVNDPDSVENAFAQLEQAWGPASVLVHCAGINMSGIPVRDMPVETWRNMLATDLTGAFLMSKRFLNGRRGQEGAAAIVHISSIHATAVRAGGADYCAAKGGLRNLIETLAVEEAATNIRVNGVEPGMILTPMNERAVEDLDYRHALEKNIPMRRAGTADEVARLVRWLASDEASYVTGANVVIDGGLSLLAGVGA